MILQKGNEDEVLKTIMQLKTKTFCEMLQLNSSLLKTVSPATSKILASIFNKCVQEAYYQKFLRKQEL